MTYTFPSAVPVTSSVVIYAGGEVATSTITVGGSTISPNTSVNNDGSQVFTYTDVSGSLTIISASSSNNTYIYSVRVDGKLLVDPVFTAPGESQVTGPTQAAASGTVKLAGSRETTAPIQTSTITNVGEVSPTITNTIQVASAISGILVQTGGSTIYSGAKTPEGVLGLNEYPDLWTPVNPNPNKNGSNETAAIEMVAAEPLSITCIGSAPFKLLTVSNLGGGAAYTYTITGDVTVTGTTGGSQGRYKALSDEVTITPNASGATFTFTANNGMYINYVPLGGETELTLTDTTDLALFTPGDVVQVDGSPNTALVYAQANDEDTGSYFNYFVTDPELKYSGWKITDYLDQTSIGTTFTFSYFTSNDGISWSKVGNYNSTESPGISVLPYGAFTIYGQSGVGEAKISLTGLQYAGTVGTLPTANPFATDVSVISTNLATPSITTDGGAWTGSDGTSSGEVADRETKVTGPVKTTEVAGPYLTLSPSSGRWLVTETGYSAPLKLNKFVKASSLQSVASLFTVMDALGNITDLSLEDPGYTEMVGDPTYTLTFPSIFSAGETPDVELPPGTKYQVEVKATNDVGVDNAFSNDVMPVAGVLQTSVITANTLKPGGWNEVAAPQANNFASISYDGSGRFVAVSSDGIQRSMYSDDGGSSWTIVNMPGENLWSSVAYGNGYFVAVSRNGTPRAAYSSDATSWSGPAGNNTDNIDWHGVAYGAGSFVAVGSNGAMESDDNGASWSQRNYASSGVSGNWKGVVYGTPSTGANAGSGVFVAVSSGSTTMYSLNKGFDWIAGGATTGENFVSVAYNNGIFVAVAENSGSMYSTDGINWTAGTANADSAWRGITYGAGKFVAVARNGTYRTMHSADGMSWEYGEAIDSGWDAVVYGGDRYVSVSNDGNTMWSLYGNDSYTELTTADNTNYNLFSAGDEVVESSGGTPETSAIINVANTPINKTQAYVFTGTPTNLADVLANGTLVTTGNTWNSSQCLVLVNNADSTIPDMTSVFSANGDTSFYLGLGESYGNPTNGGSFKADGTRLGGSGGYNNSEWTLMRYTDIANDENYDSSYRIYDDTEVAYTVIGYYNANSNITFGTIADVGTANRSLLTLTNDTNLANFRVGDAVQGDPTWNQSQVWSNGTEAQKPPAFPWTNAFDGNLSSYTTSTAGGAQASSIYFNTPIPVTSSLKFYMCSPKGNEVKNNIDVYTNITPIEGIPSPTTNVPVGSSPASMQWSGELIGQFPGITEITGLTVYYDNSDSGTYLGAVMVDGLTLVNTGIVSSNEIKVTAINEATPSITTDGGSWSGTDGTASGPNTSYNWSTAGTVTGAGAQYISNAFDGDLDTDWYGPSTYTFPATVVGTKYELDFNVSLSSSGFFINDTSPASVGIDTPPGQYLLDITALCPNGLDKITVNFVTSVASQYISAIYVDGRLLLDSSDAHYSRNIRNRSYIPCSNWYD